MTAVLRPVSRWGRQPADFNAPAAEAVYKAMMALPDDETAAIYGRVLVAAMVDHELASRGAEITKAVRQIERVRIEKMRRQLRRTALHKSQGGGDPEPELRQLAVLVKSFDHLSHDERSRLAAEQARDMHTGRFVREHQRIGYDPHFKGVSDKEATMLGLQAAPPRLKDADRAHFQQAYQQLHEIIGPFRGMGNDALVHLHVRDKTGEGRTIVTGMPGAGEKVDLAGHLKAGEHLHAVSVSTHPTTTASGAAFDALAGVGAPGLGAAAHGQVEGGVLNADKLGAYRRDVIDRNYEQQDYIPSQRVFRHLEHGSKLLRDSLGETAPRKVQFALAVGEHVGRYGPEAQRVIGPAADKAAYRYRGVEREVQAPLANALESIRRNPSLRGEADKREYLLHGVQGQDGWTPSGVLEYFRRQLPDANLNTLQLKSGVVPPSRGVVIGRNGEVTAEAVGYGDDHYLPFNLKGRSFRSLKGGEYIRTRTFGGPTTEDVYAGLMSGAKGFTVVSHNGVYTVDFNPDLKGGRRFNDNALRMVARYGHLLDAVRSGQVQTGGLDESRLAELEQQANALYPEERSPERFKTELERLKAHEIKHPTLSRDQKVQATLDFFNDRALDAGGDQVVNPDTLVRAYVTAESNKRYAAEQKAVADSNAARAQIVRERHPGDRTPLPPERVGRSKEYFESEVTRELGDPDPIKMGEKVADALGMRGQLEAHMRAAEQANRDALTPLRLNGQGYNLALKALQEQFPHYIDRVEFHPWGSGKGPVDTGYVRPKHNRAAEALTGYFDTHVSRTGAGKVYADSTRWQNRQGTPRPFLTPQARQEKEAEKTKAAAAGGKAAETDATTAAALRESADRGLYEAIHNATKFGAAPKAVGQFQGAALANQPIAAAIEAPEFASHFPGLHAIFKLTPDQFEAEYAAKPDAMRAKLAAAKKEADQHGVIDIPADVAGNFDRGGKAEQLRALGDRPALTLAHWNKEHDFGDSPLYNAQTRASTEQLGRAYGAEPTIDALVRAGKLPQGLEDGSFDTAAKDLATELVTAKDRMLARSRTGEILTDDDWEPLNRQAEGLMRAAQLRRRHLEAAERERQPAPAVAGEEPQQVVQQIGVAGFPVQGEDESDEDFARRMNAHLQGLQQMMGMFNQGGPARPNPPDNRVIDG